VDANIWLAVIGASLPSLAAIAGFLWKSSANFAHIEHKLDSVVDKVAVLSAKVGDVQAEAQSLALIRHRLGEVETAANELSSVSMRVKLLETQVHRLSVQPPRNPSFDSLRPSRKRGDEEP